jgi:hypothetical protein
VPILLAATALNMFSYYPQMVAAMPGLTLGQAAVNNQTTTTVANIVPGGGAIAVGLSYEIYHSWGFTTADFALVTLLRLQNYRQYVVDPELRRFIPYLAAMLIAYWMGILSLSRVDAIPTYLVLGLVVIAANLAAGAVPALSLRFDSRLLQRMALASAVDAYVGSFDALGCTAVISKRPAILLGGGSGVQLDSVNPGDVAVWLPVQREPSALTKMVLQFLSDRLAPLK